MTKKFLRSAFNHITEKLLRAIVKPELSSSGLFKSDNLIFLFWNVLKVLT